MKAPRNMAAIAATALLLCTGCGGASSQSTTPGGTAPSSECGGDRYGVPAADPGPPSICEALEDADQAFRQCPAVAEQMKNEQPRYFWRQKSWACVSPAEREDAEKACQAGLDAVRQSSAAFGCP